MERDQIRSVTALNTQTGEWKRFEGKYFTDCTGHGWLGVMAGASHTIKRTGHMGMSNMWRWKDADVDQSFPDIPWALHLSEKNFPYPNRYAGEWFWESGL